MPLLRRLWWAGGGRDPISVPGALRRAEERRREGRYAEAGGPVARAPGPAPHKLPPPLPPAVPHPPRPPAPRAEAGIQGVVHHHAAHPRAPPRAARLAP